MMQLRLLLVVSLLLLSCVDAKRSRFVDRWRRKRKENRLRGGAKKDAAAEPKPAAKEDNAAKPKPGKKISTAKVDTDTRDITIEKQPETKFKTQLTVGEPIKMGEPRTYEEPAVPGPGGMMHAMGPGGSMMNSQDGDSAPVSVIGASA